MVVPRYSSEMAAAFSAAASRNQKVIRRPAARQFFQAFYSWSRRSGFNQGHCGVLPSPPPAGHSALSHARLSETRKARLFAAAAAATAGNARCFSTARSSSDARATGPAENPATPTEQVPNAENIGSQAPKKEPYAATLSDPLRTLMRTIPHPIVVVTTTSPSPSQPPSSKTPIEDDHHHQQQTHNLHPSFRGMTLSSFTTVTLSPHPTISFNIRLPSSTYTALSTNTSFLVHLLRATSSGAAIAHTFTQPGDPFRALASSGVDVGLLHGTQRAEKDDGPTTPGLPLLGGAGVKTVLRCVLDRPAIPVGDHVIVLGRVVGILEPRRPRRVPADLDPGVDATIDGKEDGREGGGGLAAHGLNLVYADRAYRHLSRDGGSKILIPHRHEGQRPSPQVGARETTRGQGETGTEVGDGKVRRPEAKKDEDENGEGEGEEEHLEDDP
ncbi:MAG: hypothetical protein M1819_006418 [Sarea resinae]|nr:MAG: hypothetical protein M1819_006418 [Sarea resinae]